MSSSSTWAQGALPPLISLWHLGLAASMSSQPLQQQSRQPVSGMLTLSLSPLRPLPARRPFLVGPSAQVDGDGDRAGLVQTCLASMPIKLHGHRPTPHLAAAQHPTVPMLLGRSWTLPFHCQTFGNNLVRSQTQEFKFVHNACNGTSRKLNPTSKCHHHHGWHVQTGFSLVCLSSQAQ